jgi:hypothetical protein
VRALAATLLAAAVGAQPAAAAEVVSHRTPRVGPALIGDRVAWGEDHRGRGSDARILLGAPGVAPVEAWRLLPSPDRDTTRGFMHTPGAFDTSPLAVAALPLTGTITERGSDFVGETVANGAVGGPPGALRLVSGSLPDRGDAPCTGPVRLPTAVAVDGTRVAIAEEAGICGDASTAHLQITVVDGATTTTIPVAGGFTITNVALAGRFVLWVRRDRSGDEELVVRDIVAGSDVVRRTADSIEDAALRADGTAAFIYSDRHPYRLGLLRPERSPPRVLDRHAADRGLAIDGGRVLYERRRPHGRSELILRRLAGGERRLARFGPGHRRLGDVDLDATRATWATESRIVVQRVR